MSYPILIMCYKRVTELAQVLESVKPLNPSKIYFHLHGSDNEAEQLEVDKVLEFIQNYEGEKSFKYVLNPLGIYKAIGSALTWIAEHEKQFFVFEDDITVNTGSETCILEKMQELEKQEIGVLKFGLEKHKSVFWGWALTAKTVPLFTDFNFQKTTVENAIGFLDTKSPNTHLAGLKILYQDNRPMAWDDEYGFIIDYLKIPVIETDQEHTTHIGAISTRGANGLDVPDNNRVVTFINGVLQK